jgi:hypothetical protein
LPLSTCPSTPTLMFKMRGSLPAWSTCGVAITTGAQTSPVLDLCNNKRRDNTVYNTSKTKHAMLKRLPTRRAATAPGAHNPPWPSAARYAGTESLNKEDRPPVTGGQGMAAGLLAQRCFASTRFGRSSIPAPLAAHPAAVAKRRQKLGMLIPVRCANAEGLQEWNLVELQGRIEHQGNATSSLVLSEPLQVGTLLASGSVRGCSWPAAAAA